MNNIDLINILGNIHAHLNQLRNELIVMYPKKGIGRLDVSFYSVDRSNYPGSPVGVSWEIVVNEQDEYFTFEIINEINQWNIDGYVSKHKNLESQKIFIEIKGIKLSNLLSNIKQVINKFEQNCLAYLDNE